ncbi:MAG: hypothetical protein ACMXYA_02635, partial [Candidatus Woesearchaeota archaeon]
MYKVIFMLVFICTFSITLASPIYFAGTENITNVNESIQIIGLGDTSNFELRYSTPHNPSWYTVSGLNGVYTIPANHVQVQGMYRFYFQDTGDSSIRFPQNTSYYIIVNERDEDFFEGFLSFAKNDTQDFLSFDEYSYVKPDLTEIRHMQNMKRFANLYSVTKNETYREILQMLYFVNWSNQDSRCDPQINSYDCFTRDSELASFKQGTIITSLLHIFLQTQNQTYLDEAILFGQGEPSDCRYRTNGDYVCNDNQGQGMMIYAMTQLYIFTSDSSYKEHAYNFISASSNLDSSPELAKGLSHAYFVFQNDSIKSKAQSLLLDEVNACVTHSCNVRNLARQYSI